MTAAHIPTVQGPRREAFERWRRRSRLVRRMRVVLPVLIALILASMAGFVIQATLTGAKVKPTDADAPIIGASACSCVSRCASAPAPAVPARNKGNQTAPDPRARAPRPSPPLHRPAAARSPTRSVANCIL